MLMTALFMTSCKPLEPKIELKVQFSNPQAILLKHSSASQNAKSRASTNENGTTLFQIDGNGNVVPVIEGVTILQVKPFSYGLFVLIESNQWKSYIIFLDNTYIELPERYCYLYHFVGENDEGDLIFSDVYMIKKEQQN